VTHYSRRPVRAFNDNSPDLCAGGDALIAKSHALWIRALCVRCSRLVGHLREYRVNSSCHPHARLSPVERPKDKRPDVKFLAADAAGVDARVAVAPDAASSRSTTFRVDDPRGYRCVGASISSCAQIARTSPGPISRWRGTAVAREPSALRHLVCLAPSPTLRAPFALRCRSRSRSFNE